MNVYNLSKENGRSSCKYSHCGRKLRALNLNYTALVRKLKSVYNKRYILFSFNRYSVAEYTYLNKKIENIHNIAILKSINSCCSSETVNNSAVVKIDIIFLS